jgi:hypothetical protein
MSRILRLRPSPAMVVALLALCVALAGTASALPGRNRVKRDDIARNAVRSSDITRNAIRNRHIRARQVTRSKIARRSVNSTLVGDDALLGSNILESSLSKVPDADKLDGKDSSEYALGSKLTAFTLGDGETRQVAKQGPLTLTAHCDTGATDTAEVLVATTQDNAAFSGQFTNADLDSGTPAGSRVFTSGVNGSSGTPAFGKGEGYAIAPDGSRIGASLFAGVNVLGQAGRCVFGGDLKG